VKLKLLKHKIKKKGGGAGGSHFNNFQVGGPRAAGTEK
jgi:hypothetical protein